MVGPVVHVIFDLDGTLIDSRADLANSVNHVLTTFGLEPLELIGFESPEEVIEARDVDLELSLLGSVGDPIDQVGMLGVRRATLYRTNFTTPVIVTLDPFQESATGYLTRTWQLRQGNPAP